MKHKLVNHGVDIAPAEACRFFGLEPGALLWQALRLIIVGRKVQVITHHVQPIEVGEKHIIRDLKSKHMFSMLRDQGIAVSTMRREVLATSATPVTAHHLEISAGSPVLMVVLRLQDAEGAPIEWMRSVSRPDQALTEETLDLATGLWHAT